VCDLRAVDPTTSEVRIEVDDPDKSFASFLEIARGGGMSVDSVNRMTLLSICAALRNSELFESVYGADDEEITINNAVPRLLFRVHGQGDISPEIEFIASHFDKFSRRRYPLRSVPVSMLSAIIGHPSLILDSEDALYDFICREISADPALFGLIEFVRFEYCWQDTMAHFVGLTSEHIDGLNAAIWRNIRTRLALSITGIVRQFPPSMRQGHVKYRRREFDMQIPDGIIGCLTRECHGNVHDCGAVEVTSSAPYVCDFWSANDTAARHVADLEVGSFFCSTCRHRKEAIPHTRNNWICYDFKVPRVVPTHYAIRSYGPGESHLRSWLVETSDDGRNWDEIDHREHSNELNGDWFTGTFAVGAATKCRYIRLVNLGRNHHGNDRLCISGWEIFGSLISGAIM
jgi:hypothetical protein